MLNHYALFHISCGPSSPGNTSLLTFLYKSLFSKAGCLCIVVASRRSALNVFFVLFFGRHAPRSSGSRSWYNRLEDAAVTPSDLEDPALVPSDREGEVPEREPWRRLRLPLDESTLSCTRNWPGSGLLSPAGGPWWGWWLPCRSMPAPGFGRLPPVDRLPQVGGHCPGGWTPCPLRPIHLHTSCALQKHM